MKLRIITPLLSLTAALPLCAQEVKPVWVQHINGTVNVDPANALPILNRPAVQPAPTPGARDGRETIANYSRLIPFDSTRLLLAISENGIDEQNPNITPAQAAQAAQYPDHSLIWLDAATAKPLGIAWQENLRPADLIGYNVQGDHTGYQASKVYAFWRPVLDENPDPTKRAIYSGYKHLILRYAPKADGTGWETTPTIAWEEPVPGFDRDANVVTPAAGIGDGRSGTTATGGEAGSWRSWRWRNTRVHGYGVDTVIAAGGGTWRIGQHPQIFSTEDGLTFKPFARVDDRNNNAPRNGFALGGTSSSRIKTSADPARPNLEVLFSGHYPGTGWEARPTRYTSDPDAPISGPDYNNQPDVRLFKDDKAAAGDLPAFQWEAAGKDGLPLTRGIDGVSRYDGNWSVALDTHPSLDYLVSISASSYDAGFYTHAWLGVHRLDGSIAGGTSSYRIPVKEDDIIVDYGGGAIEPDFDTTESWLEIIPDTTAPSNLSKSYAYAALENGGFGVFVIQNTAPAITGEPQDVTLTENGSFTLDVGITGSPNTYQWYKDGVALDGTATKDDGSPNYPAAIDQGVKKAKLSVVRASLGDSGTYKLVITNPLGNVTSRDVKVTVISDSVAPTIISSSNGRSADSSYVALQFSEDMRTETLEDSANYKLNGSAVFAAKATGARSAIVYIPTVEPGEEAILSVTNVRDVAEGTGNAVAANTTVTVTGPSLASGGLLWEFYPGTTGTAVSALEADPNYPAMPTRWERMTAFNTDANGLSQVADNFGARISGWITPTVSGDYRFFTRSDDASRLYVSESADPAGSIEIAHENGCCNGFLEPSANDPNKNGSLQTSDPIALKAGSSYYIYMLYKEGGGGDWAQVAWRREGDTSAGALAPIPGSVLSSYRVSGHGPVFASPTLSGNKLTLKWAGTGALQESTDLKSWTTVPGNVASPFDITLSPGAAQKFYRIIK